MITSERRAENISVVKISGIGVTRETGPPATTCPVKPGPQGGGGRSSSAAMSSGAWAIQSEANRCWCWRASGPSMRIITSTQGPKRALGRKAASAQFWLPHQAMRSSITASLRWLRRSMRPRSGRSSTQPTGSARARRTPAAAISSHRGEPISPREPMSSTSTRQATPRRAARIAACATRVPLRSVSQM